MSDREAKWVVTSLADGLVFKKIDFKGMKCANVELSEKHPIQYRALNRGQTFYDSLRGCVPVMYDVETNMGSWTHGG